MRFAVALLLGLITAGAARADVGPIGVWLTESGSGHVEIAPCGPALCGKIVWLKEPLTEKGEPKTDRHNPDEALRPRPILGLPMLDGFVAASGGGWEGGTIYNPEEGKTYKCVMSLDDPNKLRVRGYVGIPLLGKTQIWTRVR